MKEADDLLTSSAAEQHLSVSVISSSPACHGRQARKLSTRPPRAVTHCDLWPPTCQPSSALRSSCQQGTQQDGCFNTFPLPLPDFSLFPLLHLDFFSCMNILFLPAATAPNLQGTFKWIPLRVKAQLSNPALRNVHNGGVLLKEYREVSLCDFLPFGLIQISPSCSHLGRGLQWHMHHLYVCQLPTRPRYCDMGPWATTSSKAPTFCKNYHASSKKKKNAVTASTSVFFIVF